MGCRVEKYVEGVESAVEDLRTVTLLIYEYYNYIEAIFSPSPHKHGKLLTTFSIIIPTTWGGYTLDCLLLDYRYMYLFNGA